MNAHENEAAGPSDAGPRESIGDPQPPTQSMGSAPDPDPRPVPNPPPAPGPGGGPTPNPPPAPPASGSRTPLLVGGGIAILVLLAIILGLAMK